MSWPSSPEWLRELQARFSDLLRTPLDRSSGSLRANIEAYDAEFVAAALPSPTLSSAERLAIYHRQYWFRLFTTLQGLYPLTAKLVGYWRFNQFAAQHLAMRPPRGIDIEDIGADFELSLAEQLPEHERLVLDSRPALEAAAVLDAAHVDAAFHRVGRTPPTEPFLPGPADSARFADSCLRLSPSVALIHERWPLSELRAGLLERRDDQPIQLADRWQTARHWLLSSQSSKLGLLPLEPREAQLFGLLQRVPLAQALGQLEAEVPAAERGLLPERTQAWLARSMRMGVWVGFVSARK